MQHSKLDAASADVREQRAPTAAPAKQHCGSGFLNSSGESVFNSLRESGDLSDVVVRVGDGAEYRLHALLLASRSEFFHAALTGAFAEASARTIDLQLEDGCRGAWSRLVDYFYTDRVDVGDAVGGGDGIISGGALPLLALARRLLVPAVERTCAAAVAAALAPRTALALLRGAAAHALHDVAADATAVAARSFHVLFDDPGFTALPPAALIDVLSHPELSAHCEAQVLRCVLGYLAAARLGDADARAVCEQVRYAFLDNRTLGRLALHPAVPQGVLLAACSQRLLRMTGSEDGGGGGARDGSDGGGDADDTDVPWRGGSGDQQRPRRHSSEPPASSSPTTATTTTTTAAPSPTEPPPFAAALITPPPRASYCCDVVYGLPGGCRTLTLPSEAAWPALAARCEVRVSGVSEGGPRAVLSPDPLSYFETDDSADPLPWVEIHLPPNVQLAASRYTFAHGHRRGGYFRMRAFRTLVSSRTSLAARDGSSSGGSAAAAGASSSSSSTQQEWRALDARPSADHGCEVLVAATESQNWFRAMRIEGTGRQEDGVHRLCLRNLRVFGTLRADLMRQHEPGALVVDGALVAAAARAAAAAARVGGGALGSPEQLKAAVAAVGMHSRSGWSVWAD